MIVGTDKPCPFKTASYVGREQLDAIQAQNSSVQSGFFQYLARPKAEFDAHERPSARRQWTLFGSNELEAKTTFEANAVSVHELFVNVCVQLISADVCPVLLVWNLVLPSALCPMRCSCPELDARFYYSAGGPCEYVSRPLAVRPEQMYHCTTPM